MPNVSSRWPSKLGGSAAPTKTNSPPYRGLSWAWAGPIAASKPAMAKQVRISRDRLAHCPMSTSDEGEKVPRTISHAWTHAPGWHCFSPKTLARIALDRPSRLELEIVAQRPTSLSPSHDSLRLRRDTS